MSERPNERTVYLNGELLPESRALISYRDRGFYFGDGCFDITRSFNRRLFFLEEHVERLYRSLRYLRIDPGLSPEEISRITEEVFERNKHLLGPNEDYWVGQRITRGPIEVAGEPPERPAATVVIECMPLPLKARAHMFRDGARAIIPSVRRTPPEVLSPRVKSLNYLNLIVADHEVHARDPNAWAILLDVNGNLCEGLGSNIFVVKDGVLMTPSERYVLPGVSRQKAMDFARASGVPVEERDIDLYDAYAADEAFITSTSLCVCPLTEINGVRIGTSDGGGAPFGPVTRTIVDAYAAHVDCDFVAQYLAHLE
jgi:branched-chain amino acid aminotransferase